MAEKTSCIIIGAGPKLGAALAKRFAIAGHDVAVASRNPDKLNTLIEDIKSRGGSIKSYNCDGINEAEVINLFDTVEAEMSPCQVAIYNASARARKPISETSVEEISYSWQVLCLGGFLLGREAAKRMQRRSNGSILFTGATASMKGYPHSATFAIGKFGLRGLAESMARELHPMGIHVAHFNIDGGIGQDEQGDSLLRPESIAETYYQVHMQHRSAWSHNVEVRPWAEKF